MSCVKRLPIDHTLNDFKVEIRKGLNNFGITYSRIESIKKIGVLLANRELSWKGLLCKRDHIAYFMYLSVIFSKKMTAA